jgi:hypothetical protein
MTLMMNGPKGGPGSGMTEDVAPDDAGGDHVPEDEETD